MFEQHEPRFDEKQLYHHQLCVWLSLWGWYWHNYPLTLPLKIKKKNSSQNYVNVVPTKYRKEIAPKFCGGKSCPISKRIQPKIMWRQFPPYLKKNPLQKFCGGSSCCLSKRIHPKIMWRQFPPNRVVLDFFLARTLDWSLAETVFWTSSSSLCLSQLAELGLGLGLGLGLSFVRIFCSALSYQLLLFLSNFPIITSCCHHNFSSPHHHTITRDHTALPNLTSPSGINLITFNLSKGMKSLRLCATWHPSKLISPHHHKANNLARTKLHQSFVK